MTTTLSSQIVYQRKKKGLTQEELAALTGVTVRTIQRLESGETRPRPFTLKAIASALEIPFETLMEEGEEGPTPPAEVPVLQEAKVVEHSSGHFLQVLCLSCFSFILIPYVHFLVPFRLLGKNGGLPSAAKAFAQKLIRVQIGWVVGFHLFLLLTLAYNLLQARYGTRTYLVNYLWVVLGMYFLNTVIIALHLLRSRRFATGVVAV